MRSYKHTQELITRFEPILAFIELVGYDSLKAQHPDFSMSEDEVRAVLANYRAQVAGTDKCAHEFFLAAQKSRGREYTADEADRARAIIMQKMDGLSFFYDPECPTSVKNQKDTTMKSAYTHIEQELKAAIPNIDTADEKSGQRCTVM